MSEPHVCSGWVSLHERRCRAVLYVDQAYCVAHRPKDERADSSALTRVLNQIRRHGLTFKRASELSDEELAGLRNMGQRSVAMFRESRYSTAPMSNDEIFEMLVS